MGEELPSWLNKEFLTLVLQNGKINKPAVNILSFGAQFAVAPGNNYTSQMYRISVEYEVEGSPKSASLMVKVPLMDGFINQVAEKCDFFSKEPEIYKELLPRMFKKTNNYFGPKPFYCPIEKGLILEDLKVGGYTMCDKTKQLDYSHCKMVLKKLAIFHAVTVVIHHERPQFVERVGEDYLFTEGSPVGSMANSAIKSIKTIVESMEDCKLFNEYLGKRMNHVWKTVTKLTRPKQNGLNVLNHGDLWVNNMLFKYNDNGYVADVKFIDYQLTRYGSPANDLVYFIWTSANEEVRGSKLQNLYDIYLNTFNSKLQQFGSKERLSMNELKNDLELFIDWALLIICQFLPIMLSEPDCAPDLGQLRSEDFETDSGLKMFHGKHFLSLLPSAIKSFTDTYLTHI